MKAAMVRFLLPIGALIVLAGCASSPYRTGYYYPSEYGQGDYYSAPAERRYDDSYYSPYYYGGFYIYPYYRGGHGFYGRYPYSPYRHSRLGFSLNYGGYGGYGPGYGSGYGYNSGYGYSSPRYNGFYRQPYRGYRSDHRDGDHHRESDHGRDRDDRDHREHRTDRDRRDHTGQQPIQVRSRDSDPNRYLRRSAPDKNDPGTQRPMRVVGNRADDGLGHSRNAIDGSRSESDSRRRIVGTQPTIDTRRHRQPDAEPPIRIRQTAGQPRVVQQPRFVDDRANSGKRRSIDRPAPGPAPVMSGQSRAAVAAPSTGGRSTAIGRAPSAPRVMSSPRSAQPVQAPRAQSAARGPTRIDSPKTSSPKTSGRGKAGAGDRSSTDRSSEIRQR